MDGSISHSMVSKGKIVYSNDESLYEYFEEYKQFGKSDMDQSIFFLTVDYVSYIQKIEKWLTVKKDLTYARLYLLKAAEVMAQIEVCKNCEIPTREAILQAKKLNPKLIEQFYEIPIEGHLNEKEIVILLEKMDEYIISNMDSILAVVSECMEPGEIKTITQISKYFKAHPYYIIHIFEYLYPIRA